MDAIHRTKVIRSPAFLRRTIRLSFHDHSARGIPRRAQVSTELIQYPPIDFLCHIQAKRSGFWIEEKGKDSTKTNATI